jgi:protein-S-isoprenylcysteine O-methyltransferase Ste14
MALREEFAKQGNLLFKYRGTLPIIAIIAGAVISISFRKAAFLPIQEFYYELVCLSFSLIGLVIRMITIGFSAERTSGRNRNKQIADQLNTTGFYASVRHPLYLGNFLMWLGVAMLCQHAWFILIFVLTFWIYYERIMFAEEQFLMLKFGDDYHEWANKTPAFIPSLGKFVKPVNQFNWYKALSREKNGIAALFILFYLFHSLGQWIDYSFLVFDFWGWSMLAAIGYYSCFKLLKYYN